MTFGARLATIVAMAAFAVGIAMPACQAADPVADFYRGKQVLLISGGAPGT
jgi:hypothetical protein